MNRVPFEVGEWYHCYSRGIDKRRTYTNRGDYERFVGLLYICNSNTTVHRSDFGARTFREIVSTKRGAPLTDIGAFCLMPNHFHLLLRERAEGGISDFMRKIGTSYTMYFNLKHERSGNLFAKPFRSRHVSDDRYLQQVIRYIHSNPAELFEAQWKSGVVHNMHRLEQKLLAYPYSSLAAFTNNEHPMRVLLSEEIFDVETQPSLSSALADARQYYNDVKVTP